MPLDQQYLDSIKKFEGFTPRATWDYKQNSNGYGTRARYPGEVIDRDEAERRFQAEIKSASDRVDSMGVSLTPGQRAALTSLTFNAGPGWMKSGLGDAVRAGDWDAASKRMNMYVNAGGQQLPGLVDRRSAESQWLQPGNGDAASPSSAPSPMPSPSSPSSLADPARYVVASGQGDAALPSVGSSGDAAFDKASKAMRLASAFSAPQSTSQTDLPDVQFAPLIQNQGLPRSSSGGLDMAMASLPYVRTRAEGGALDDSGMTVPEPVQALLAQQRQLIDGRRAAQMFPVGTEELPLPPGMQRVETPRGVFHFDPLKLTEKEVIAASKAGRENELLGLGPMSKSDVADVMRETGEKPVAITERDPMGNEVRGSLATPSTVPVQSDEILRTADPRNSVNVEPVDDVIAHRAMRLARDDAGPPVESRASGGGIGNQRLTGALYGSTGGRADKIPGMARAGSHVIPADIVSHMGQGNSNAGLRTLEKMFTTGPYGMSLRGSANARKLASGGGVESDIPVMLSDGEYVVDPEVVTAIGNGDLSAGHDALDQWIMHERQNAIRTLSSLPPPATD